MVNCKWGAFSQRERERMLAVHSGFFLFTLICSYYKLCACDEAFCGPLSLALLFEKFFQFQFQLPDSYRRSESTILQVFLQT